MITLHLSWAIHTCYVLDEGYSLVQEELTSSCLSTQIKFSIRVVLLDLCEIPVSVLCVLARQIFQERSVFPIAMRDTMVTQGLSGESFNPDTNIMINPALARLLLRNSSEIVMFLAC